jgi:hypothetical protein
MKKERPIKKKKEPIIFDGIQYDSEFEVLFQQWVKEAISYGYIGSAYYHPSPFVLCDSSKREYKVIGKKKQVTKSHALFSKIVYTADWWIFWEQKAVDMKLVGDLSGTSHISEFPLMFQTDERDGIYSVIDIKPPKKAGGNNASYRDFGIKAPLIWNSFNILIQSVVPIDAKKPDECFFSKCWAPKSYLERPRKDGKGFLMSYCKQINIDDYERTNKY